MSRPRIVCLVGPTASGKSALALDVAERVGAEIVSADSRQLYRGLDVATGKPTREEQTRVPHHGFDRLEPAELSSAGDYVRATRATLKALEARVART